MHLGRVGAALLVSGGATACGATAEPRTLRMDVRTDQIPGVEIDSPRAQIAGDPESEVATAVDSGE